MAIMLQHARPRRGRLIRLGNFRGPLYSDIACTEMIEMQPSEIADTIRALGTKKAAGLDGLHPAVIKLFGDILVMLLNKLPSRSFLTAIVPTRLKGDGGHLRSQGRPERRRK